MYFYFYDVPIWQPPSSQQPWRLGFDCLVFARSQHIIREPFAVDSCGCRDVKSIKVGTCNVHVVDRTCGALSPLFKHTHCILAQRIAFHLHAHVFEGLTNCSEIVCVVREEIVRRIHQQVCLLSLHPFLP